MSEKLKVLKKNVYFYVYSICIFIFSNKMHNNNINSEVKDSKLRNGFLFSDYMLRKTTF